MMLMRNTTQTLRTRSAMVRPESTAERAIGNERNRSMTPSLMSFDVAPQQDLYTEQGVAVTVEAVAQIKVKSDPESILTAAEQFLTKPPDQREGLIRLVMEGHLRGAPVIGQRGAYSVVDGLGRIALIAAAVQPDRGVVGAAARGLESHAVSDESDAYRGQPAGARFWHAGPRHRVR